MTWIFRTMLLLGGLIGCVGCDEPAPLGGDSGMGPPTAEYPYTPPVEPGRHLVELVDTRRVVPAEDLPAAVARMNSNNNLDVVRHADGRVYLAWRSAPDHFAGSETLIQIISSEDEENWRFEGSFGMDTDLREPRLLSLGDKLILYVSVLGLERTAFEPMGVVYTQLQEDGAWSALMPLAGSEGLIAWRTRVERGVAYMIGYRGGEHIYRFDGTPLSVELMTTTDGVSWAAVNPERPVTLMGGGSEADFTLSPTGELFGVVRNEAGDDTGYGSHICRADPGDITDWRCVHDARKFDSPLMFWHDGEAYLVARRHVSPDGHFELEHREGLTRQAEALTNQLEYSLAPKRCALWRYVQEEDRIAFLLDLPSRGDTCFPAWLEGASEGEITIYNYSSDVAGDDVGWAEGQAGPTYIYRHTLQFRANPRIMD